jgi:hypothetical protein
MHLRCYHIRLSIVVHVSYLERVDEFDIVVDHVFEPKPISWIPWTFIPGQPLELEL